MPHCLKQVCLRCPCLLQLLLAWCPHLLLPQDQIKHGRRHLLVCPHPRLWACHPERRMDLPWVSTVASPPVFKSLQLTNTTSINWGRSSIVRKRTTDNLNSTYLCSWAETDLMFSSNGSLHYSWKLLHIVKKRLTRSFIKSVFLYHKRWSADLELCGSKRVNCLSFGPDFRTLSDASTMTKAAVCQTFKTWELHLWKAWVDGLICIFLLFFKTL